MQTKARKDVELRLQSIKTLQTQPAVVAKITKMLQNPATNANELGDVIKADLTLSSTVLRLVNSAFYGLTARVGNINHAIVLLGLPTVRNIVLTASVLDMFKADAGSCNFDAHEFSRHSLACGVIAQYLAQTVGYEHKEECFVAGLIHDIGKVTMLQVLPEDFKRVIECADKTKTLFYDSERKLSLGIDHQDIGGMLVEQWRLPPEIHSAVLSHHNPPPDSASAAIVHCADVFARALGYGNGGDRSIPEISDAAWDALKLSDVNLPNLFNNIEKIWCKADSYIV